MYAPITFLYNEPLRKFSTIRIGGFARKIAIITDERQLMSVMGEKPFVVVGKGSNVLFSDDGYDGLVIVLKNSQSAINQCALTAGAGATLIEIAAICQKAGLSGLEWACGIPSCVGGAVYMNAGAHGSSISDIMTSCRVLREDKIIELSAKDCGFGYRTSAFKDNKDIILSANFLLTKSESGAIREKMQVNIAARKKTQPIGLSLGSVFKNPDKPAGYYIEQAGLKGTNVGDLCVSEKHANFIINRGSGTAKDFLTLVDIIKAEVYSRFGVKLTEEFIKIGEF